MSRATWAEPMERFQGFLIFKGDAENPDAGFWWRERSNVYSDAFFDTAEACRADIVRLLSKRVRQASDDDVPVKITLSNAGGPLDTIYASSQGKAVEELIAMLETLNELHPGDTITVEEGV